MSTTISKNVMTFLLTVGLCFAFSSCSKLDNENFNEDDLAGSAKLMSDSQKHDLSYLICEFIADHLDVYAELNTVIDTIVGYGLDEHVFFYDLGKFQ